jgi:hypothetical protein
MKTPQDREQVRTETILPEAFRPEPSGLQMGGDRQIFFPDLHPANEPEYGRTGAWMRLPNTFNAIT